MKQVYQAAKWAKNNPILARIIIIISTILSVGIHYYGGIYLFAHNILIPYPVALIGCIVAMIGILIYPERKKNRAFSYKNFRKSKILDFTIFFCGALMVIYLANARAAEIWANSDQMSITEGAKNIENSPLIHFASKAQPKSLEDAQNPLSRKELRKKVRREFKELRKIIKAEIRELKDKRKNGESGKGLKVLLILLTLFLALVLATVVSLLACSVACNGNEFVGSFIAILGMGGIIFLTVYLIKKIVSRDSARS